ncbi:hypothetical protein L7F22_034596 [Adiantum nelumboides]|nr:hypothetical protein [Adiantum nelumboides]
MEGKEAVPGSIPGMLMLYTDGSYQRLQPPSVPACPSFLHGDSASEDVTLDPAHGSWARIFMPKLPSDHSNFKLPVVLYFHGSGFCVGSASLSMFHSYCSKMAFLSSCLAPEYRLPAAYDDSFAPLLWFLSQASLQVSGMPVQASTSSSDGGQDGGETLALHWLNRHADFSNKFLAGESASATITYFTAARASHALHSSPRID